MPIELSKLKPIIKEDWFDMRKAAKLINRKNMGRTNLFRLLRDEKILMEDNEPYQNNIDKGYFKVELKENLTSKQKAVVGSPSVTLVSLQGISFIKKRIEKKEAESNGEY